VSDEQTHSLLLVVLGATAVWLWWSGQVLNHVRPGLAPGSWPAGWSWSGWGCCPPGAAQRPAARPGPRGPPPAGPARLAAAGPGAGGAGGPTGRARVLAVSGRATVPGGDSGLRPWPPRSGARSPGRWPSSSPAPNATRPVAGRGPGPAGRLRRPQPGQRRRLSADPVGHLRCAADAEALQAVVTGDPTPRARDQWLQVEGTWQPRPTAAQDDPNPPPPALQATSVRPLAPARPPYESSTQYNG
jgi:hypothetical protein